MEGGFQLIKITRTVSIPINQIQMIVDYADPFAIRTVRDAKKNGNVRNIATVERTIKTSDGNSSAKKRGHRPAVKCVIFLQDGYIMLTATSKATIEKRYAEALTSAPSKGDK